MSNSFVDKLHKTTNLAKPLCYSYEKYVRRGESMERKLPKNIRQIGNVSDNPKVYVEDYVDTFVAQLCEKAKEKPVGAFLIGETFRMEEQDYIFIHGAVLMEGLTTKENEIVLGDKTWKKACEEGKKYFAGNTILGWVVVAPDLQMKLNHNLIKLHERLFMKKSRVLVLKDATEKEEAFYVYKYNDLMEIAGHYIYYEKNTSMQDYMIANRKQNCVTPSETYEDRATKDFRSVINQKEKQRVHREKNKYAYMVSVLLVLLVAGMGVASINEYNELQMIQGKIMELVGSDEDEITEDVSIYVAEENAQSVIVESPIVEEVEAEDDMTSESVDVDEDVVASESMDEDEDVVSSELMDDDDIVSSELVDEDIAQGDEDVSEQWQEYTVEEGDTLDGISIKICGSREYVETICEINNLEDSDVIYAGQVLLLP